MSEHEMLVDAVEKLRSIQWGVTFLVIVACYFALSDAIRDWKR